MQEEVLQAKHIVIVLQDNASIDYIASANALYTYLLTIHKKVSMYCENIEHSLNMNFLPWMSKLKNSYPSSSDYEMQAISSIELIDFFLDNKIKLNHKMATSLYAGLIDVTAGFSKHVDGMVFARAELLVNSGADVKICNDNVLNYASFASLRLKAILLSKMKLEENAEIAVFNLYDEDLKKSGASIDEASSVFRDALALPTVKSAKIIYKTQEIMKEDK